MIGGYDSLPSKETTMLRGRTFGGIALVVCSLMAVCFHHLPASAQDHPVRVEEEPARVQEEPASPQESKPVSKPFTGYLKIRQKGGVLFYEFTVVRGKVTSGIV